jgi:hypothetical protein
MKTNEFINKLQELIYEYDRENDCLILDIDLKPQIIEQFDGKKSVTYDIVLKMEGR